MISSDQSFSLERVKGFSRLFESTAMSFELEARRMSRQILPIVPRSFQKRSKNR